MYISGCVKPPSTQQSTLTGFPGIIWNWIFSFNVVLDNHYAQNYFGCIDHLKQKIPSKCLVNMSITYKLFQLKLKTMVLHVAYESRL